MKQKTDHIVLQLREKSINNPQNHVEIDSRSTMWHLFHTRYIML